MITCAELEDLFKLMDHYKVAGLKLGDIEINKPILTNPFAEVSPKSDEQKEPKPELSIDDIEKMSPEDREEWFHSHLNRDY